MELEFIEGHKAVRIVFRIKLKIVDRFRRNPASAQFEARKCCPIENQDIKACLAKFPRAGRTGGPAAYDDGIDHVHFI
jgi:hypothetical protein